MTLKLKLNAAYATKTLYDDPHIYINFIHPNFSSPVLNFHDNLLHHHQCRR